MSVRVCAAERSAQGPVFVTHADSGGIIFIILRIKAVSQIRRNTEIAELLLIRQSKNISFFVAIRSIAADKSLITVSFGHIGKAEFCSVISGRNIRKFIGDIVAVHLSGIQCRIKRCFSAVAHPVRIVQKISDIAVIHKQRPHRRCPGVELICHVIIHPGLKLTDRRFQGTVSLIRPLACPVIFQILRSVGIRQIINRQLIVFIKIISGGQRQINRTERIVFVVLCFIFAGIIVNPV